MDQQLCHCLRKESMKSQVSLLLPNLQLPLVPHLLEKVRRRIDGREPAGG